MTEKYYTQQEAIVELNRLLESSYKSINDVKAFAKQHGLDFYFDNGDGFSACYLSKPEECMVDDEWYMREFQAGWQSSSFGC